MVQVEHGHNVWVVDRQPQPKFYDALITAQPNVTLMAAGADCLALIFVDPVRRVVGVAHAGWRGTVERVAKHVVDAMVLHYGSRYRKQIFLPNSFSLDLTFRQLKIKNELVIKTKV